MSKGGKEGGDAGEELPRGGRGGVVGKEAQAGRKHSRPHEVGERGATEADEAGRVRATARAIGD